MSTTDGEYHSSRIPNADLETERNFRKQDNRHKNEADKTENDVGKEGNSAKNDEDWLN